MLQLHLSSYISCGWSAFSPWHKQTASELSWKPALVKQRAASVQLLMFSSHLKWSEVNRHQERFHLLNNVLFPGKWHFLIYKRLYLRPTQHNYNLLLLVNEPSLMLLVFFFLVSLPSFGNSDNLIIPNDSQYSFFHCGVSRFTWLESS